MLVTDRNASWKGTGLGQRLYSFLPGIVIPTSIIVIKTAEKIIMKAIEHVSISKERGSS
jgi:hypothetical protein